MPIVDSDDLNICEDGQSGQLELPRSVEGRSRLFAVVWAIIATAVSLCWLYLISAALWAIASELLS